MLPNVVCKVYHRLYMFKAKKITAIINGFFVFLLFNAINALMSFSKCLIYLSAPIIIKQ